jgi:hypothetical protein
MKTVETVGCWMWYVNQIKANTETPITDYKELLKSYMAGKTWETIVKEMSK